MGTESNIELQPDEELNPAEESQTSEMEAGEIAPIEPDYLTEHELIVLSEMVDTLDLIRLRELSDSYNQKTSLLLSATTSKEKLIESCANDEALRYHIENLEALIAKAEASISAAVSANVAAGFRQAIESFIENRDQAIEESGQCQRTMEDIRISLIREFGIPEGKVTTNEETLAVLDAVIYSSGVQISYDTQFIRFIVSQYLGNQTKLMVDEKVSVARDEERSRSEKDKPIESFALSLITGSPVPSMEIHTEEGQAQAGGKEDGEEQSKREPETPVETEIGKRQRPYVAFSDMLVKASQTSGEAGRITAAEVIKSLYTAPDGSLMVKSPTNSLYQVIANAGVRIEELYPGTKVIIEGRGQKAVFYLDPPIPPLTEETDAEIKVEDVVRESPLSLHQEDRFGTVGVFEIPAGSFKATDADVEEMVVGEVPSRSESEALHEESSGDIDPEIFNRPQEEWKDLLREENLAKKGSTDSEGSVKTNPTERIYTEDEIKAAHTYIDDWGIQKAGVLREMIEDVQKTFPNISYMEAQVELAEIVQRLEQEGNLIETAWAKNRSKSRSSTLSGTIKARLTEEKTRRDAQAQVQVQSKNKGQNRIAPTGK